jgi:hypothetical protein
MAMADSMAIAQKLGLGALKKFRARKDPNRQSGGLAAPSRYLVDPAP